MGKKYLIDTNVIAHLFADKLPVVGKEFVKNIVDVDFIISAATEIEILTFRDGESKVQLIEEFVNIALILPLDKAVTKRQLN